MPPHQDAPAPPQERPVRIARVPGRRQGVYWIATIPQPSFVPYLPPDVNWICGQMERGAADGYLHWQFVVAFRQKKSLAQVRGLFGEFHFELSRSDAANAYVNKEDTRVPNTHFELGVRPFKRNVATDWDVVRRSAQSGDLESIPADVYVRCYHQLRSIRSDHVRPVGMVRTCAVFWGPTATGKSRTAWDQAGLETYAKDPRTKWWCGYSGHHIASLTNSAGILQSPTCFGGSIVIPFRLKQRVHLCPCVPLAFGSRVTSALNSGTPMWTPTPGQH